MSKIKLESNPSGTGTFTIQSPASSTDRTLTLPDGTGEFITQDSSGNVTYTAPLAFTDGTERIRIDSSGNLLVGTTDNSPYNNTSGSGFAVAHDGYFSVTREGVVGYFNRNTSDGDIVHFRKNGTTVGSIGAISGLIYIGNGDCALYFNDGADNIVPMNASTLSVRDNAIDLGAGGGRFDDIYATNGTIQTSDEREKQDIDVLSDAEQRVAVAAKGLIRKYRWKDSVAEKGDDARIHFGVIAQDLKAAFEAEGLDAGRYAMFIHSEWWETQTEVPAVEEEVDEDGNVITEAKEAYTRTDTFDTEAEAPEGAVKKDRMGVRYPELLAFIIGAM